MPDYDFRSLSSVDFERLVRDLLQQDLGVRLESFKSGRDRGIDLRYASGLGRPDLIVQCKHYAGTALSKLLQHLRDDELSKIKRLKPTRYVLATSVALSPDNKDAIVAALHPWCRSPRDVLGRSDLNGLLARFPAVERTHHKLWLASTQVLEAIIHSDVFNQRKPLCGRSNGRYVFTRIRTVHRS